MSRREELKRQLRREVEELFMGLGGRPLLDYVCDRVQNSEIGAREEFDLIMDEVHAFLKTDLKRRKVNL